MKLSKQSIQKILILTLLAVILATSIYSIVADIKIFVTYKDTSYQLITDKVIIDSSITSIIFSIFNLVAITFSVYCIFAKDKYNQKNFLILLLTFINIHLIQSLIINIISHTNFGGNIASIILSAIFIVTVNIATIFYLATNFKKTQKSKISTTPNQD